MFGILYRRRMECVKCKVEAFKYDKQNFVELMAGDKK